MEKYTFYQVAYGGMPLMLFLIEQEGWTLEMEIPIKNVITDGEYAVLRSKNGNYLYIQFNREENMELLINYLKPE